MVHALVAGQNLPWPGETCMLRAPDLLVLAVPLGADDRVLPGSRPVHGTGAVAVGLPGVPVTAQRVVLLGVVGPGARPGAVRLEDGDGTVVATFAPDAALAAPPDGGTGASVVALAELYRRAGVWKLRAVGRAYPGGLGGVETAHGVRIAVTEKAAPPARAPAPSAPSTPGPSAPPPAARPISAVKPAVAAPRPGPAPASSSTTAGSAPDPARALELVGMVLEDASRSAASYESTVAYAERMLGEDVERVVADPALRVSADGDRARDDARRRRDELVVRAGEVHVRELATLRTEIAGLDRVFGAGMASWEQLRVRGGDAVAADRGDAPPAIRAGEITLPHLADLPGVDFRMPMLWRVPSTRALLVTDDDGGEVVAARVAAVLGLRALFALAVYRPRLVLVDLGGARGTYGLPADLVPPPLTTPAALRALLVDLERRADLLAMARQGGAWNDLDQELLRPVVVVITDVPTGWDAAVLPLVHQLTTTGLSGVQVILSGPGRPPRLGGEDGPVDAVSHLLGLVWREAMRLPSAPGGDLADSFAGVRWTFLPDLGPDDPDLVRTVMGGRVDGWDASVLGPAGAGPG